MKSITSKKGQLGAVVPAILSLTLAAIVLVFGLLMLNELWGQTTAGTEAYSAGNETIAGVGKFAEYFDLMVLAVVISIVIGLLLVVFSVGRPGGKQ